MKKLKKPKKLLKKPGVPSRFKKPLEGAGKGVTKLTEKTPFKASKTTEEKMTEALSNVPRITNETLSEHREEVLRGARKYIYPLQHSKHSVVKISLSIFVLVIVAFFALCGLSLYKFQNTGGFIYDVTRIIPFPVAKSGSSWVSYESYLFELRRNMHYYQTQQQANFKTKDGKAQLNRLKHQAMEQVVQDAYVKQLARQNGVTVTDLEVDNQVDLVRQQSRLGSNERNLKVVLSEFWGWSEDDFKRELKQQLLKQAVVVKLDTQTTAKANAALKQVSTTDFATLASQVSDDVATKANGGQYPAPLTTNSRELAPAITAELFKLKAGQVSGIVDTGYTLDILKVLDRSGNTIHAAHIQFTLADVRTYVAPLQKAHPGHQYIRF
jgi:hypothetical protein